MAASIYGMSPNWNAGGTIAPFRFLVASSAGIKTAVQATAETQQTIGVSNGNMLGAPGLPGSDIAVHANTTYPHALIVNSSPMQEIEVEMGGTVTQGSQVMSDGSGKAIAATGTNYYSQGVLLRTNTTFSGGISVGVIRYEQIYHGTM